MSICSVPINVGKLSWLRISDPDIAYIVYPFSNLDAVRVSFLSADLVIFFILWIGILLSKGSSYKLVVHVVA